LGEAYCNPIILDAIHQYQTNPWTNPSNYPFTDTTLQGPLWAMLEQQCTEAELLRIAAAMGPAQQRALDSAVTKALTNLMVSGWSILLR
jgi:hypothetical protein